jgi:hypothetical protein
MKNILNAILRFMKGLQRPSKRANLRRMRERGDTLDSFTIREATVEDIPALAALHVKTWMQTYHRLGLGKRLLCTVVRRFVSQGINSVLLFSESSNPSGYFHEAMGAKKLFNKHGGFDGGYGWYDLQISSICSIT